MIKKFPARCVPLEVQLTCPIQTCKLQFRNHKSFKSHMDAHKRKVFTCTACKLVFGNEQGLEEHYGTRVHRSGKKRKQNNSIQDSMRNQLKESLVSQETGTILQRLLN